MKPFLAVVLVYVFVWQCLWFMRANCETFDEPLNVTAGYSYWSTGDFRMNEETPPLIQLLIAAPLYFTQRPPFQPDPKLWSANEEYLISSQFLYHSAVPAERMLAFARLAHLALGVALLALIAWWARRMWGAAAGLCALGLAAFDPNLIAHASLATTDLGPPLLGTLCLYLGWEQTRRPSSGCLLGQGVALGLLLASKNTSWIVVAAMLTTWLALLLAGQRLPLAAPVRWNRWLEALFYAACLALAAVMTLALIYRGQLWRYSYGLDYQVAHQQSGHLSYYLGQVRHGGWWSYYLVAFLVKTPLATLLLLAWAIPALAPRHAEAARFLIVPVAAVFALSTQFNVAIGVRYILVIYPLLYVFASGLAAKWPAPAFLLVALAAASSLRIAPHQIAYYNEMAGGPLGGPRYVADTNVDWGQDLLNLKQYMAEQAVSGVYLSYFGLASTDYHGVHFQVLPGAYAPNVPLQLPPGAHAPPTEPPRRELLAISLTNLRETIIDGHNLYEWLEKRTPLTRLGWSIYVYDITADADAHGDLARVYWRAGSTAYATWELERALALSPQHAAARALLDQLRSKSTM